MGSNKLLLLQKCFCICYALNLQTLLTSHASSQTGANSPFASRSLWTVCSRKHTAGIFGGRQRGLFQLPTAQLWGAFILNLQKKNVRGDKMLVAFEFDSFICCNFIYRIPFHPFKFLLRLTRTDDALNSGTHSALYHHHRGIRAALLFLQILFGKPFFNNETPKHSPKAQTGRHSTPSKMSTQIFHPFPTLPLELQTMICLTQSQATPKNPATRAATDSTLSVRSE